MNVCVHNSIDFGEYNKMFALFFEEIAYPVQQTPLWVNAYYKSYCNNVLNPVYLCFKSKDIPIGMLLIQRRKKNVTKLITKRYLEIFGKGPTDFFQIITKKYYDKAVFSALSQWLYENRQEWDEFILSEMPERSIDIELLLEAFQKKGFEVEVSRPNGFYFVDTTVDWSDYFHGFIKKRNKDLLKDLRKISRNGIQLRMETHQRDIYEKLRSVLHLYFNRRKSLGQINPYGNPERKKFLQHVTKYYESNKWVELTFLKDEKENIWAFQLDWLFNGVRYHWNHAYNESFKKYSPGKILLYYLMKQSFSNPLERECNHMRGLATYKSKLANQKEYLIQVKIINPFSIRNKFLSFYNKFSYLSPRRLFSP